MTIINFLRRIYYFNLHRRLRARGDNVILGYGGFVTRPQELSLGSNVFIGRGFSIWARDMRIGSNVMIGPDFLADCDDHVTDRVGRPMFAYCDEHIIRPITIEDDVWIGARVTVLRGVTIAEGCVVGAGSVVTTSLPPYTVCVGVPCKPRKPRFSADQLRSHLVQVPTRYDADTVQARWRALKLLPD
jgi:acetyltransferase-like isoleucine patch superfamily enzyme